MPTGYTATLMEKGQTFQEFALLCARAMGATITMRDDPLDAPIPDAFHPGDYAATQMEETQAELARLLAMNDEEKLTFGQSKKDADIAFHERRIAEQAEQNGRIMDMRSKVEAWQPPTTNHEGMKCFMLQQLAISLHDTTWNDRRLGEAQVATPLEYYDAAVSEAKELIVIYTESDQKERKNTEARNIWIRQLRESLNTPTP